MCLPQGQNAVTAVRIELALSGSREKHSTIKLLHFLRLPLMFKKSKEEGKDQESIQTNITPYPGQPMRQ